MTWTRNHTQRTYASNYVDQPILVSKSVLGCQKTSSTESLVGEVDVEKGGEKKKKKKKHKARHGAWVT